MTMDFRPWRRLLFVWLPAVVLCVAAAALYVWQTSESGGRRAQVGDRIAELEAELVRLSAIQEATGDDRARVSELEEQFEVLFGDVFGSLEQRLTGILRAVGSSTRNAGLLPEAYSYSANVDRETGFVRFGIKFAVEGEYPQIRRMLAELQSSPEFLIVEGLSLSGDEDAVSRMLRITVNIATFLAQADDAQLQRLTGTKRSIGASDG